MNKIKASLELRKALQLFLEQLDPDVRSEDMLSVSSVFPKYVVGKQYRTKEVFRYGVNAVGDPQLYQALQEHISQEQWTPDTALGLYKKIGVTEEGYPQWVQPLGASDAYNTGDVVSYKDVLYRSAVDGNVWQPGVHGWEQIGEQA